MKALIVGSLYPPDPPRPPSPPPQGATPQQLKEYEDQKKGFADAEKAFPDKMKEFNDVRKPQFIAACHALGAAFARKDYPILVGVTSWQMLQEGNTVASYVPLGADTVEITEGNRHPIVFDAPQDPEPLDKTSDIKDTLQEFRRLPNVDLQERFVHKSRAIDKTTDKVTERVKMIPNVAEVDAVVLIGGTYGTSAIGYAAYSMNKPVIAITGFGGTAKDIADDILFDDYDRFAKQKDVTAAELRALGANWNADIANTDNRANADLIVQATQSLTKAYGKANKKSLRVLLTTTIGMAALLVAWMLVYLGGSGVLKPTDENTKIGAAGGATTVAPTTAQATQTVEAAKGGASATSPTAAPVTQTPSAVQVAASGGELTTKMVAQLWSGPLAFFLLLYIAALLGAGLRVLASYQSNEITQLTFLGLWVDLVVSLVVAFGLALLYLIGSISFTGDVVVLKTGTEKFANIAVSMSLLGLAAGYLVPLNQLRQRLEKIVAEEQK